MAERRMLAKSIIESDFFSDMPVESQMLYIRLNMMADDDGFVSNPRAIMRMYGFNDDSMRLLMSKNFVLEFKKGDNFVYLIKHWKIHNTIQKDRYKRSAFQELLREVYLDENKAYSLNPGEGHKPALSSMDPNCIQDVSKMYTQDRIGKDSIDKISLDQDSTGKGVQGENPSPIYSDPQKKIERIDYWIKRMEFSERQGWDKDCWFNLAAAEGIKRSEIELRIIQLQKQGEQKNEQT